MAWIHRFGAMVCDDHFFGLGYYRDEVGLIKTGLMSFGVNGLRAVDVDRENREPTIEGLKLKEGINREK